MSTNISKKYSEQLLIAARQSEQERDYWLSKLSGDPVRTSLFADFKRIENGGATDSQKLDCECSFAPDSVPFQVELMRWNQLKKISGGSDDALNVFMISVLVLLLSKYTGETDILLGTPIYKQDIEGAFINTVLPLRNIVEPDITFKDLLMQVRQTVLDAEKYQSYPMQMLMEKVDLPSKGRDFTLFEIAVLTETLHERRYINHTCPNVLFIFNPSPERLECTLEYNPLLYKRSTIEQLTKYFLHLLDLLLTGDLYKQSVPLSAIDLLSAEMKFKLLYEFNRTEAGYPHDATIHEVFAEQVKKFPGHIAFVFQDRHITYEELDKRADRLALMLRARGVKPDSITGMLMKPSVEMIIGIMAILKAGGAYLPIDPTYPSKRIISMLEDTGVDIVLTRDTLFSHMEFSDMLELETGSSLPIKTAPRPQIKEVDKLPIPDRSLVDYEKYGRFIGISMVKNNISIQATRGCPYNCAYCHKIWPKRHISRSAEVIYSEVKLYYDMGFTNFTFVDDIFNLDIENSRAFFQMIIDNGLDVRFHFPAGVRGDILTKDYIDLMVKAGTTSIALALETASPRLQKLIGKHMKLDRLRENARYFAETYPHVILELFTMHGFPTETKEEALQTLEFVQSLKWIHFPYFHILKIYPNTDMEQLAIKHGVSQEAVNMSRNLAYHELPETLPFEKSFTLECQSQFFNGYFLSKERLLAVLPMQMKVLTEAELVQKYHSYLPVDVATFDDLLDFTGIRREELGDVGFAAKDTEPLTGVRQKMKKHFSLPGHLPGPGALKVLLLDLSQLFSGESGMLYDVVEAPLGLLSLMTYLKAEYKQRVDGRVAKSRIDFNNFKELKQLLDQFQPDVIGIRTLTYYKDFFHRTVAMIANWGFTGSIIAGGPYATSDYERVLSDPHVDLVVMGEGELTFNQVIGAILDNRNRFPGEEILQEIPGISYLPGKRNSTPACQFLIMDALQEQLAGEPSVSGKILPASIESVNSSGDLAYVIFTSGSTGRPKGVLIEHRNVIRLIINDHNLFDFNEKDTWTLFHSYCFDFSVWEIFGALLTGAKLIGIPRMLARDPGGYLKLITRQGVTVLNQTPSVFYNLVNQEEPPPQWQMKLRYVIFGGEALQPVMLKPWMKRYTGLKFINMFGITETTVHVTYREIAEKEILQNTNTIGSPIPTLSTYVMDDHLNLLPIGVPGELMVGGDGVARGYLNRPELTAKRFVSNPYKNERLYRSGDLGRILENGDLEYHGRKDHQVKIRGFRVELEEIEHLLLKHSGIKDAVVLSVTRKRYGNGNGGSNGNGVSICAFVVPANPSKEGNDPIPGLRKYLARNLPEYMVPAYIVPLNFIPLTSNGKVDRKALPDPVIGISSEHFSPPVTEVEKQLVAIWADILGAEKSRIGIDVSFFEMGGHSLKATILEASIHKQFDIKIPLTEIFNTPTIRELAIYIERMEKTLYVAIKKAPELEYYPLSPAQKRLYFLQQTDKNNISYNIPLSFAPREKIDIQKMKTAFRKLIQRHESLRTSFIIAEEQPVQKIHDDVPFDIESHDSIDTFLRPFDLSVAPLFRVAIINLKEQNTTLLVMDTHHIITDAFSMNILSKDFSAIYDGRGLAPLALQYKDYSYWCNSPGRQKHFQSQEKYWLEHLSGSMPRLQLPLDYPRPETPTFDGRQLNFQLDQDATRSLNRLAKQQNATLYMVLLALYNVLLSRLSGQERIIVGSAVAGRNHDDLKPIIGNFLNTLPILNFPKAQKTFKQFLGEVRQTVLNAFENQDYPFDEMVEKLDLPRENNRSPVFDVMFGLQNVEISTAAVEGLKLKPYNKLQLTVSKSDLLLLAFVTGQKLQFQLKYKTSLFKEETVKGFIVYFERIVREVLLNPNIQLKSINILSEEETEQLYSMLEQDEEEIEIGFNI